MMLPEPSKLGIEQLSELISTFYGQTCDKEHFSLIDKYLTEWTRNAHTWTTITDGLMKYMGGSAMRPELVTFLVTSMKSKIIFDLHEVPTDDQEPLVSLILQLTIKSATLNDWKTAERLSACLTHISMQTIDSIWPDPINSIRSVIDQSTLLDQTRRIRLYFLIIRLLCEESLSNHACLLRARIDFYKDQIYRHLPVIVEFLRDAIANIPTLGLTQDKTPTFKEMIECLITILEVELEKSSNCTTVHLSMAVIGSGIFDRTLELVRSQSTDIIDQERIWKLWMNIAFVVSYHTSESIVESYMERMWHDILNPLTLAWAIEEYKAENYECWSVVVNLIRFVSVNVSKTYEIFVTDGTPEEQAQYGTLLDIMDMSLNVDFDPQFGYLYSQPAYRALQWWHKVAENAARVYKNSNAHIVNDNFTISVHSLLGKLIKHVRDCAAVDPITKDVKPGPAAYSIPVGMMPIYYRKDIESISRNMQFPWTQMNLFSDELLDYRDMTSCIGHILQELHSIWGDRLLDLIMTGVDQGTGEQRVIQMATLFYIIPMLSKDHGSGVPVNLNLLETVIQQGYEGLQHAQDVTNPWHVRYQSQYVHFLSLMADSVCISYRKVTKTDPMVLATSEKMWAKCFEIPLEVLAHGCAKVVDPNVPDEIRRRWGYIVSICAQSFRKLYRIKISFVVYPENVKLFKEKVHALRDRITFYPLQTVLTTLVAVITRAESKEVFVEHIEYVFSCLRDDIYELTQTQEGVELLAALQRTTEFDDTTVFVPSHSSVTPKLMDACGIHAGLTDRLDLVAEVLITIQDSRMQFRDAESIDKVGEIFIQGLWPIIHELVSRIIYGRCILEKLGRIINAALKLGTSYTRIIVEGTAQALVNVAQNYEIQGTHLYIVERVISSAVNNFIAKDDPKQVDDLKSLLTICGERAFNIIAAKAHMLPKSYADPISEECELKLIPLVDDFYAMLVEFMKHCPVLCGSTNLFLRALELFPACIYISEKTAARTLLSFMLGCIKNISEVDPDKWPVDADREAYKINMSEQIQRGLPSLMLVLIQCITDSPQQSVMSGLIRLLYFIREEIGIKMFKSMLIEAIDSFEFKILQEDRYREEFLNRTCKVDDYVDQFGDSDYGDFGESFYELARICTKAKRRMV